MLNIIKSLLCAPEQKISRTARLIAIEGGGRARWTPRDYAALAREGYGKNAIVHRAVRLSKAPFLTVNEKRAAVGYGAVAGGDVFG